MPKGLKVLIIDPCSPYAYEAESLKKRPMGGTEATVLRVALGLSNEAEISIAQKARTEKGFDGKISYFPFAWKSFKDLPPADHVIVLRNHKIIPRLRKVYPDAKFTLWLHCVPGKKHKYSFGRVCATHEVQIVCVSNTHRNIVTKFMAKKTGLLLEYVDIKVAYNPVVVPKVPEERSVDKNKLVFVSSPHKGFSQVYENFMYLKERIPELKFYVANPGYMPFKNEDLPGVKFLGELAHKDVLRHMRESLCLFYPQSSFAETFGLVFAEANALGTPALTHDVGAAKEVLSGAEEQLVDADSKEEVLKRIQLWREQGPPSARLNPKFEIESILERWRELLGIGNHISEAKEQGGAYRTNMPA